MPTDRLLVRAPRKVWHAISDPSRTLDQSRILRDLIEFRQQAAPFRAARAPVGERGTALVISLSDFVFQLKVETVIAKALELQGYRPMFLTLPGARWAPRYFEAFGYRDLVYPPIPREGDVAEAARAAEEMLAGEPSVQALKELRFREVGVGRQVLSTLSRRFQRGRIDVRGIEEHEALPALLTEAIRSVYAGEALLERLQPEIVIFLEKGYVGFGALYDVALARGANVIQYVNSATHRPNALMLKRYTEATRDVHPASLSTQSWEIVRTLPWNDACEEELEREFALRYGDAAKHPSSGLQEEAVKLDPESVRRKLGLTQGKRTAVVFSHVLWDANLFYGRDLFEDQEQWLVETVRAACANPELNWVVKLHPANRYKANAGELNDERAIRDAVGALPPHVRLLRPETEISTWSLFAVTDYGITIRGTVGFELPALGIPALTAGTGRYSGLGFTIDSDTAAEYVDRLRRLHEQPPLDEERRLLAKRYAHAVFHLRPLEFASYSARFMQASRLSHPLSHNLRLNLRTPREVESADDLRRLGEWAADPSQLDYLAL